MSEPGNKPDRTTRILESRLTELRSALAEIPLDELAGRAGARCVLLGPGRGELHLSLWQSPVVITYPNLTAVSNNDDILPDVLQALLLYYFYTADGTPPADKWVSFADLPDGRMYAQAFQGYSGNELIKAFDPDIARFRQACTAAGGVAVDMGDAAFIFSALPRVPLLVNYWLGDEDFPSSCKVLFDANATHYLPIDACAILGSMLVSRIKNIL